jgi:predicted metal-dependent hydrolase
MNAARVVCRWMVLGGRRVRYSIRESKTARKCRIRVNASGVEVVEPRGAGEGRAGAFLRDNARWVLEQVACFKRMGTVRASLPEARPDSILLRGTERKVEVIEEPSERRFALIAEDGGVLRVRVPKTGSVEPRKALEGWLRRQAKHDIKVRLAERAAEMKQQLAGVYIMNQRTKWGGCSRGRKPSSSTSLRVSLLARSPAMRPATYLVFGDLHGRVLPAFKLAQAWAREHGVAVAGLLQVGELGYFPDSSRFDKATQRYAAKDALEGGVRLVAQPSAEADAVFADELCPEALWFTAGNHEDYELLKECERGAGRAADSFAVDAYGKLRCIRDGRVAELPGGLRVGALWGIDDRAPRARRRIPPRARISYRGTMALRGARFDVLLVHESPRDAILADSGSEDIASVIRCARPAFAFFGHYHPTGRQVAGDFGDTRVYHLSHLELRSRAEEGSVGVLTWNDSAGDFAYLDPAWLRTVTRHNWKHR